MEEMMDIVECGEKWEEDVEICETIVDEIVLHVWSEAPHVRGEGGEGPGAEAGLLECGNHQQQEECHPPLLRPRSSISPYSTRSLKNFLRSGADAAMFSPASQPAWQQVKAELYKVVETDFISISKLPSKMNMFLGCYR
jgi:hypothetical protein